MPTLLVVHHTTSPALQELLDAVLDGTRADGIEGVERAAESITKGLGWQPAHAPVTVMGAPSKDDREACWDLGATVAATLAGLT